VSYDFFVVGTIDDAETVEKRRKRGVDVLSLRVSVRVDRTHSHSGGCRLLRL